MADISKISPDNGTTIYNLKDIEARKRVPEVLLKDTVGWTGKNLLKPKKASGTSSTGISYSIDENGCKLNGTATSGFNVEYGTITLPQGSYVYTDDVVSSDNTYFMNVSPNPSTGSGNLNINNKPFSFTLSTETTLTFMVYVRSGQTLSNLTFYPMLRKADISDSTYEPYHESVEEVVEDIRAEQTVLGAKNLLPNNASTQTINGVTFTVNADGSVTANGTASADISLNIYDHAEKILQANVKYILSGCPKGGSLSTYYFGMRYLSFDYGDGTEGEFTSAQLSGVIWITVFIKSGTTVNNLVFKPMLRLASDPDNTYATFAMTNKEITEELAVQESAVTTSFTVADNVNYIKKIGKLVQIDLKLSNVTATSGDALFTVPEGFRPSVNSMTYLARHSGGLLPIAIYTNGSTQALASLTNTNCQIHIMYLTS